MPGAASCAPAAATSKGTAPPDRNDEYLFYQMLLGAWPAELTGIGLARCREAARPLPSASKGAMIKSLREAKVHSTWAAPNPAYEEAMLGFVRHALDPARSAAFLESIPAVPGARRAARRAATAWCRPC